MARFVIEDEQPSEHGLTYLITGSDEPAESVGIRQGRQLPDPMKGFITAFQGPTLNYLDEITGGVQGLAELATGGGIEGAGKAYREGRDLIRGAERQFREDRPTLANLSSLAAAMPVFVAAPQAKLPGLGAGVGGNTARAVANALPLAAVASMGASDSDTAGGVVGDAVIPTLGAAGIAAAIPGGGAIVRGITDRVKGAAGRNAGQYASEKVAEQLVRDAPAGTVFTGGARLQRPGGVNAAGNPLPPTVENYGSSDYLNWLARRQEKLGPGALLADVGGKNTFGYLDTLAEMPGTTGRLVADAARKRGMERGARLGSAADETLGKGGWFGRKALKSGPPPANVSQSITRGASYQGSVDDMVNLAREQSRPYYDLLQDARVVVDDEMMNILRSAKSDLGRAERIIGRSGRFDDSLRKAMTEGGEVRILDAEILKQSLYDAASKMRRAGANNEARSVDALRQRLITKLEDASPMTPTPEGMKSVYRLANDAYAGPAQLRDAMELGRKSLSPDKNGDIAAEIARLSTGERESFKLGVVQAVKDLAGEQSGQTRLLSFFKSPNLQARLKQAFGPDYREFAGKLLREEQLKRIATVGGGSKTFARFAAEADMGEEAIKDMAQMATSAKSGSPMGMFGAALRLYNRTETPEPVRNEIGRILMLKGPEAQKKLQELALMMEKIQASRMKNSAAIGIGVGGATASVQPMIRPQAGEQQ